MITELERNEFHKCRRLVNDDGQMEVLSVVEGFNDGRIFVDDAVSPASGLIWLGNNDGFFFIGDEKNERFISEIDEFIDSVILPDAKSQGLGAFEAIGNHPGWNITIEAVFHHRGLEKWNQKVYKLLPGDYLSSAEPQIDSEYTSVKITRDFSLRNSPILREKLDEFWESPDDFFANGIGYAVLHNQEIVSLCTTEFVFKKVHSLGIETREEHRGKKLAQKAAHSLVQECLNTGIVPYWDCMNENKPSIAIAESLGFTNVFDYTGYYFTL
jgi:GNAT superfamily N-acetyltransferase